MKNLFLLFVFLTSTLFATAKTIAPDHSAPLFDHLSEINKEWNHFYQADDFSMSFYFKNDAARIKMHLMLVEDHLRKNTPEGLSVSQVQKRFQALDHLKAYFRKGQFPKNDFHSVRQPYFIDQYGTACAVGQLVIETGFQSLAEQISDENNYAYIKTLGPLYSEIKIWADEFGFTMKELAWIQPGYPPVLQEWNEVGNGGGVNGNIHVMKAHDDQLLYCAGDFTEIDGTPVNSIATWNGISWSTLGNGVSGIIYDMEVNHWGRVYIAGDFYVNDHPEIVNLAYWEDGAWHGYETEEMNGIIYSIHLAGLLYVGGQFQFQNTDGDTIHNLCIISPTSESIHNFDQDFSVNGPVRDFANVDNNILVVGDFTETGTYSNNPNINHLETSYMAYWNHIEDNWTTGFDQNIGTLSSVLLDQGFIYVGKNLTDGLGPIGIFGNGLWQQFYSILPLDNNYENFISGIIPFNNRIFFYGNFRFEPVIGTWSKGIFVTSSDPELTYEEGGDFDGPVTAAEVFQDQIYFAGDFTSVQDQEFAGLVSSPFDGTTNVEQIQKENPINIYSSPNQINIQYQSNSEDFEMQVFNLNGQLMTNKNLPSGSSELSISTQDWASGIYVYQVVSKSGKMYSGKVSVMQ